MQPSDDQALGGDSGLEVFWRSVKKSRLLITVTALVVTGAVTFYTLGQTKVYRATAMLQIDPTPPSPLGTDVPAIVTMGDAFWNNQEYYATQYRILKSRSIAAAAVRDLALDRDGAFLGQLHPDKKVDVDPNESLAISAVLGRLSVDPVKESRLVTVSFDDSDPERARRVLGAVTESYLRANIDDVAASNTTAGAWLREQLVTLKGDLESSELALHDYKKDKQILSVSLDDQSNMLREEMKRLNDALTDVRVRREHVQSRSRQLDKVRGEDPADLPAAELLENVLLNNLRGTFIAARSELASLTGTGKGDRHPDVMAARAKVDTTRGALLREIKNVQGALRAEVSSLNRESSGLARLNEAAKQRAFELNKLEIEYRRLERTKANNEKVYGVVLERAKESDLASLMRFNNIRIIEEPLASSAPVRPRVPLNIALGAIVGLLFGLLVAFGRDQLDRSIRTPDGIERDLGLPFLGSLPFSDSAVDVDNMELQAHAHPASALAEAARGIRTNLLFMSPDQPYRRLLITSPGPSEGKTTVATTIAIALAQAGQRVLLIDGDLRRPRIHRIFGCDKNVGLSTVTLRPALLDEAKFDTVVPNLSVLPAGPFVPNPAEFLHSEAFNRMLDLLGERYDRVIIDSPPISVVSDAAILATKVDGVMVIFRSQKTPRDTAKKALKSLRDVGATVVGAVLNALDPIRLGYGKYSYYQYQYQYGYQRKEGEDDAA